MAELREILLEVMDGYTGKGLNAQSYLTRDELNNIYTVITFADVRGQHIVNISLAVQFEANLIIIKEDINNKPLVDALLQAGVARENIILTYAGEKVPTTT